MNLFDLHKMVEWPTFSGTMERWAREWNRDYQPTEEWRDSFRNTLILYALPEGMVEKSYRPGFSEERMHHARSQLARIGVWQQIANLLVKEGLYDEAAAPLRDPEDERHLPRNGNEGGAADPSKRKRSKRRGKRGGRRQRVEREKREKVDNPPAPITKGPPGADPLL